MIPTYGNNKTDILLIVVLFALALALRAIGADLGYFLGDERINDAAKVLTGELVPGQHFYPPLFNYLNAVAFGGLFAGGLVTGMWDSPGAFRAQYFTDPTAFYITARFVTACTGALLAPMFYAIALRVGLGRRRAFVVGLFGVAFPLAVYLSHIAKGDVALATATVACFWAFVGRLQTRTAPRRWDITLGLMFALTVSFKISGVFVLAPFAIGALAILIARDGAGRAIASFAIALIAFAVVWPILNIGIVLDLERWIAFQRIQSVMSLSEDGAMAGLATFGAGALRPLIGLGPILAIVALLAPALWLGAGATRALGTVSHAHLQEKPALWAFWIALAIGTLIVAVLAGARQPEQLFLPMIAGFLLLAALTLASLTFAAWRPLRLGAAAVIAAALALNVWAASVPIHQALAVPITERVDGFTASHYPDRGVVTMLATGLPQTAEAQAWEFARWDRLAQKYNVEMPEVAPERIIEASAPGAVRFVGLPLAFYGLEDVDADDADIEVQAHAWPMQPEEWALSFWLDQDFTVFIIANAAWHIENRPSELLAEFLEVLAERCEMVAAFDPAKPLFLEYPTTIYDCALP